MAKVSCPATTNSNASATSSSSEKLVPSLWRAAISRPIASIDDAPTFRLRAISCPVERAASTPGFLWMVTGGNDRVTQVNAGRAYLRVQLAATAFGVSLQPLQQALQEYPEQAAPHAAIRRLLDASPSAQTVQMWARAGFAPPIGPPPRRGVDAQLVRA